MNYSKLLEVCDIVYDKHSTTLSDFIGIIKDCKAIGVDLPTLLATFSEG